MSSDPISLAVLLSGGGTTLQNLIDEIEGGRLNARIGLVIASRPGVGGLTRASDAKIMNFVVERRQFDSAAEFSKQVFSLCTDAGASLLCLAGWLSKLEIPATFAGRIMNIHPALLPSFGGLGFYGSRVHQAVLDHGCKISGCTVHFVDDEYDHGPIILQRSCAVQEDDTAATLAARVFDQEKQAYPEAIRLFHAGRLKIEGRQVKVLPPAAEVSAAAPVEAPAEEKS